MAKKKPRIIGFEDTNIETWFERDRANVSLSEIGGGVILDIWDEDVNDLAENGFLDPKDWHNSMYDYAVHLGLIRESK